RPAPLRPRADGGRAARARLRARAVRPARDRLDSVRGRVPRRAPASLEAVVAVLENRAVQALRRPANWVQLAKFGIVGALGYLINLAVYVAVLGLGPHPAAAISFVVAAASNYWWNRH